VAEPKIRHTPQVAVDDLAPYVAQVLDALGHPEALVTDDSFISDFLEVGGEPHQWRRGGLWSQEPWQHRAGNPEIKAANEARLQVMREKLGVPIERGDRIVAVALLVKNRTRALPV